MKASDPTGSHHNFDYKTLKVIGCQAYTYIKKEQRDKLSPKARDLVMVGYNDISKGSTLNQRKSSFLRMLNYSLSNMKKPPNLR
jgi:hypothetical protein